MIKYSDSFPFYDDCFTDSVTVVDQITDEGKYGKVQ